MVSIEELEQVFDVNFETGEIFWKINPSYRQEKGKRARCVGLKNAWHIQYKSKNYLAHRIVWALYHKEWPNGCIDHINRDRSDNSIKNLRIATKSQNRMNVSHKSLNKTGCRGVFLNQRGKKYKSQIMKDGKLIHLGSFNAIEDAKMAYGEAAKRLFGDFVAI